MGVKKGLKMVEAPFPGQRDWAELHRELWRLSSLLKRFKAAVRDPELYKDLIAKVAALEENTLLYTAAEKGELH